MHNECQQSGNKKMMPTQKKKAVAALCSCLEWGRGRDGPGDVDAVLGRWHDVQLSPRDGAPLHHLLRKTEGPGWRGKPTRKKIFGNQRTSHVSK